MITADKRTLFGSIKYALWPAYRRAVDAETLRCIEKLMADPSIPCKVGGYIIHDGYGRPLTF